MFVIDLFLESSHDSHLMYQRYKMQLSIKKQQMMRNRSREQFVLLFLYLVYVTRASRDLRTMKTRISILCFIFDHFQLDNGSSVRSSFHGRMDVVSNFPFLFSFVRNLT